MRSLLAFSVLLVCSCASIPPMPETQPWCVTQRLPGTFEELSGVSFWPVRVQKMAGAVGRLREHTVIQLTNEQASHLIGPEPVLPPGRYYLARSSIYAVPGASIPHLVAAAQTASFQLWYADSENVLLATLQPTDVPGLRAQNIALVMRADVTINRLLVGCYSIR